MAQRFGLAFVSLILLLSLNGCWDIKYLDQLSIVNAIGVDEDPDKPENVMVTLQVVVPSQASESTEGGAGSGGGTPVTNYSGKGETLMEAIYNMSNLTPRRLYFSHNKLMVVGESLARKGIGDWFDAIERNPEIRTDFDLLVARNGKAQDILMTMTSMEKLPVRQINEMSKTYHQLVGISYPVKIRNFLKQLTTDQEEPAVGSIELIGDAQEAQKEDNMDQIKPDNFLIMGPMAVFKGGKLKGYLKKKDSRGLTIARNKLDRTLINVPIEEEGNVTIGILHSQTRMSARMRNGQPEIVIKVDQRGDIYDVKKSKVNIQDKQTIHWIEKETEKRLKSEIEQSMFRLQNHWKLDAAGYGKHVNQSYPKYWKQHRKEWDSLFPEIATIVEVHLDITSTGIRNKSYLQDLKQ